MTHLEMQQKACLKRTRALLDESKEAIDHNDITLKQFPEVSRHDEERDYQEFIHVLRSKATDLQCKKKVHSSPNSSNSTSSSSDKLNTFLDDVANTIPDSAENSSSSSDCSSDSSSDISDDRNRNEGKTANTANLLNNIDAIGAIMKSNSFWNDLFMMEYESLSENRRASESNSSKVNVIEF